LIISYLKGKCGTLTLVLHFYFYAQYCVGVKKAPTVSCLSRKNK